MSTFVAAVPLPQTALPEIVRLPEQGVVFFDGVCGFCSASVNFCLTRDRAGRLLFAPLQGVTAQQLLTPADVRNLKTLVLWTPERVFRRSAAVVRILWRMQGLWPLCGALLWLVPLPLRDLGYVLIARSRYRLFGKLDACRMPTPEERERFLP